MKGARDVQFRCSAAESACDLERTLTCSGMTREHDLSRSVEVGADEHVAMSLWCGAIADGLRLRFIGTDQCDHPAEALLGSCLHHASARCNEVQSNFE